MIQLDKYLIAFIVFTVFMLGGIGIMAGINADYPSANVNANLSSYDEQVFRNILSEMNATSMEMQNKTLYEQTTTLGVLDRLLSGAYKAIRLIGQTFTFVPQMLGLLANKLMIPDIFITGAFAAIIIAVIITIIYLIMRLGP